MEPYRPRLDASRNEIRSIAPALESSKNKDAINDYDALVPVLEQLDEEGRMLFIQVDT